MVATNLAATTKIRSDRMTECSFRYTSLGIIRVISLSCWRPFQIFKLLLFFFFFTFTRFSAQHGVRTWSHHCGNGERRRTGPVSVNNVNCSEIINEETEPLSCHRLVRLKSVIDPSS